jgi:cytoskeletal protein RodZ
MFEIGNTLREARNRRRIDLTIAEQDTKIRSKYLDALEQEAFDVLPGAVYTRGFLRTYARYLGLDPQPYIDEYNDRFARFEEAEEAIQGMTRVQGGSTSQRTMRRVIIVGLVALAVAIWIGIELTKSESASPPSTSTAPTSVDDAATAAANAPADG